MTAVGGRIDTRIVARTRGGIDVLGGEGAPLARVGRVLVTVHIPRLQRPVAAACGSSSTLIQPGSRMSKAAYASIAPVIGSRLVITFVGSNLPEATKPTSFGS